MVKTIIKKLFLFTSLFLILPLIVLPKEDQAESQDLVFNEITLTNEEVKAVDTSGEVWHYDFNKDIFIKGAAVSDDRESSKIDQKQKIEEIEKRAVYELKVSPWEKVVQVGYDEYVDGDIIAFGRVTIRGWVRGNVKSLSKRVLVTGTGRVDGNIEAPSIVLKDDALVMGKIIETDDPLDFKGLADTFSIDGIIIVSSIGALLLMTAFLILTLAPRQFENFHRCMQKNKVRTYFLGLLLLVLLPALIILLAVTVVGIAVIPFVPILYLTAIIMGVISLALMIGNMLIARFFSVGKGLLFKAVLGMLLFITLWMFVAFLLGAYDEAVTGFGIFLLVIAIIITSYPLLSGIGTALLTRFGFREYKTWFEKKTIENEEDFPAPPPIPEVPAKSPFKYPDGTNRKS